MTEREEHRTQLRTKCRFALSRIRNASGRVEVLNNLFHHLSSDMLKFCGGKRSALSDGEIETLAKRLQTNRYRPAGLRPSALKINGKKRNFAVPSSQDVVVQRTVMAILTEVFEKEFSMCNVSYCRRGFGLRRALEELPVQLVGVDTILKVDIADCFGCINHATLLEFLKIRISDAPFLNLVFAIMRMTVGGSQSQYQGNGLQKGMPLSPLLCNIYLHYVVDHMLQADKQAASGPLFVLRYVDDILLGFGNKADAELYLHLLHSKLQDSGLKLNESKSRLIQIRENAASMTFLGFVLVWDSQTRQFLWSSAPDRLNKSIKSAKVRLLNCPLNSRAAKYQEILSGFLGHAGLPGNEEAVKKFKLSLEPLLTSLDSLGLSSCA